MVGRAANEAEGSQGWLNTEPAGAPPCSLRAHRDYNDAYFLSEPDRWFSRS